MPNLATSAALVETATKCFATAFRIAQFRQAPLPGRLGVGHRFDRRERFRGDDEQRFLRIQIVHRFGEIAAVDVRNESERAAAIAVKLQRLVGHHRPKIAAADADVDDVFNRLAGVAAPLVVAHPIRKVGHLIEHRMHLRHHVFAIDHNFFAPQRSQRHVQHGAAFGDVDFFAGKHGVDPRPQAAFASQLQQQPHGFVGDEVFRVIEIHAHGC